MANQSVAELLSSLHRKVVLALLAKVESGEASAADLNVARAMLRDNGINSDPTSPDDTELALAKALSDLGMELPQ